MHSSGLSPEATQVFENMEMNLRELTRKVGVGRGIKIEAVGNFALQARLSAASPRVLRTGA